MLAVEGLHQLKQTGVALALEARQSTPRSLFHSPHWPNSQPEKMSLAPGYAHIQPNSDRSAAKRCHSSPGIFDNSDPLPCTTSS